MISKYIDEHVVEGKRLGRHLKHDPESLRYPFKAETSVMVSTRWSLDTDPLLDQGNLGSCTGNATVGALICSNNNPLHNALDPGLRITLNETLALKFYSQATRTDGFPGQYPPQDTGSDGLDAAKAATTFGYINGYTHALSLNDVLAALTQGPVIIGVNWTEGFDTPDANGLVKYSGKVRGGHEFCLDEIDVERKLVWFRNSWGPTWSVNGRACMTWDTLQTLLDNQGDVTVFVPLTQPAPVPTPTPVPPTPTPVDADHEFAAELRRWLNKTPYFYRGLQGEARKWLEAKGL